MFIIYVLYYVQCVSSIPTWLRVLIINGCWILLKKKKKVLAVVSKALGALAPELHHLHLPLSNPLVLSMSLLLWDPCINTVRAGPPAWAMPLIPFSLSDLDSSYRSSPVCPREAIPDLKTNPTSGTWSPPSSPLLPLSQSRDVYLYLMNICPFIQTVSCTRA